MKLTTGTTSPTTFWEWGKSTLFDATTTSLGLASTTIGQITLIASTTQNVVITDGAATFPPNNYLNLKWGGAATVGTCTSNCSVFVGTCKAEFIEN